jgi:hypothetical protein
MRAASVASRPDNQGASMSRRLPGPTIPLDERGISAVSANGRRGAFVAVRIRAIAPRLRAFVLSLVLAALWIALVGWAADAPPGASFQPAARERFAGSDFGVVMGSGFPFGKRLGVNSIGRQRMALQSLALPEPIDAASRPVLRYRFEQFPRTLELSFVFRRAVDPEDVHTIALPPAGAYPGYFDLSAVPEWRGRIVEIGFAEFPTAQLVPADIAFRPFALVEVELWSPSWRGSLGALGTDWSAYRPWALMSVSALGPDAPWPHKLSPVLLLAIGLGASVALGALVLARGRRWIAVMLCLALGGGWLALDLRWLGEFADRHALTRELYAGKPWRERATIEPDTALVQGAARVRDALAREPADTHVIVAAPGAYEMLRLAYHLVPANAATVGVLTQSEGDIRAMRPALLVVYDDDGWTFDAMRGVVRHADDEYAAAPVDDEGKLRIFRLRGAAR